MATATTERYHWYQVPVPGYQQIKLIDIRWGSHIKVWCSGRFSGVPGTGTLVPGGTELYKMTTWYRYIGTTHSYILYNPAGVHDWKGRRILHDHSPTDIPRAGGSLLSASGNVLHSKFLPELRVFCDLFTGS